jgi:hypothetical protein
MKKIVILLGIIATINFLSSCGSSVDSGGSNKTATLYDYNGDTIKTWSGDINLRGLNEKVTFNLGGERVWIKGGIFVYEEEI